MQISGKWGDMYRPKAESLCMRMLWRRGGFRAEVWGVSRKVGEKRTAQSVQSSLFMQWIYKSM